MSSRAPVSNFDDVSGDTFHLSLVGKPVDVGGISKITSTSFHDASLESGARHIFDPRGGSVVYGVTIVVPVHRNLHVEVGMVVERLGFHVDTDAIEAMATRFFDGLCAVGITDKFLAFSRMAVVDSTLGLARFLLQQAFVVISDHVAPTHFVLSLWTFGDAAAIDRVPGGVDAFPVFGAVPGLATIWVSEDNELDLDIDLAFTSQSTSVLITNGHEVLVHNWCPGHHFCFAHLIALFDHLEKDGGTGEHPSLHSNILAVEVVQVVHVGWEGIVGVEGDGAHLTTLVFVGDLSGGVPVDFVVAVEGRELVPFSPAHLESGGIQRLDPHHVGFESTVITWCVLSQFHVWARSKLLREVDTCASFSSGVIGGVDHSRLFAVCLLDAVHCQPSQLALAQSHEAISSGYCCACVHSPWTDHFDPGDCRHEFTLVVDIFVVLEFQQDLTGLNILSTVFVLDPEFGAVEGGFNLVGEVSTSVIAVRDVVSAHVQIFLGCFPCFVILGAVEKGGCGVFVVEWGPIAAQVLTSR